MTILPWSLLILGCLVIGVGYWTGRRGHGRTILTLGATNAALGLTILVAGAGTYLRLMAFAAYGLFLLIAMRTVPPSGWRGARVELALAGGIVVALSLLHVLHEDPVPLRTFHVVLVSILTVSFVVVSLFRGFRIITQRGR